MIYYIDKNEVMSCIISFSTSSHYPPCGRFSDGLLSLALLKKETHWKLIAFNTFADYQGHFSTADPVSSVIVLPKKDELFVVECGFANGVPIEDYTPIGGNLYLYESLSCTQILKILNSFCFNNGFANLGSKWDTKITISDTQSDTSIIKITTQGIIDKENVWYVPLELSEMEMDSTVYDNFPKIFNFEIIHYYAYCNGKIALTDKILRYNYG